MNLAGGISASFSTTIDASPTARDVCAAYFESVDWTVNVFCVLMGSLGIVFLLFRHRDDDQEKHSVPKPF